MMPNESEHTPMAVRTAIKIIKEKKEILKLLDRIQELLEKSTFFEKYDYPEVEIYRDIISKIKKLTVETEAKIEQLENLPIAKPNE